MGSTTILRPTYDPNRPEILVGDQGGDVLLGLRLGDLGEIRIGLTVEAAELVGLALGAAILRAMVGDIDD